MLSKRLDRLESRLDDVLRKLDAGGGEDTSVMDDWHTVGETLDRIMFFVFFILLLILTIVFFAV